MSDKMEFEDLLRNVGGYGKYQKYLTAFFLIPVSCILPWVTMDIIFMVSVPDHWCHVPVIASSNLSLAEQRAPISSPEDPSCTMFDIKYSPSPGNNFTFSNNTDTMPCTLGWEYDKSNYESTAATKWNMVCDQSYLSSLVITIQRFGSLALTPLYSFLADRYGRKKVYLLLTVLNCTAELASVLVGNFTAFAILRIISGSCIGAMISLPFILILEIVAPEMRAHMNGIINTFFTIGLCFLPLVSYLSRSWVNLGLICSSVWACNLVYWKFIPESPCWLISRGKYEEATNIMDKIGKKNGKPQDYEDLYKQIKVLGDNIKNRRGKESNFKLFLKYPRVRRHFFILSFSWATFFVTYFGLMYNVRNLSGNEFINFFLLSVVEIPGNFAFWVLIDRAGRRWTASIAFFAIGIISLLPVSGWPYSDIICSMLGKFISTGLFMVTDQQASELFPTVARSFGIGLGKTISNASTLFIPFLADLGTYGKALPFVVMSCTSLFAGILASCLPETLGENLPQTFSDAESLGKEQKFFSWKRTKRQISPDGNAPFEIELQNSLMKQREITPATMVLQDSTLHTEGIRETTENTDAPLISPSKISQVEIKGKGSREIL